MADHVHSNSRDSVNPLARTNGRDLMNKINSFLKGCCVLAPHLEDFYGLRWIQGMFEKPV